MGTKETADEASRKLAALVHVTTNEYSPRAIALRRLAASLPTTKAVLLEDYKRLFRDQEEDS